MSQHKDELIYIVERHTDRDTTVIGIFDTASKAMDFEAQFLESEYHRKGDIMEIESYIMNSNFIDDDDDE